MACPTLPARSISTSLVSPVSCPLARPSRTLIAPAFILPPPLPLRAASWPWCRHGCACTACSGTSPCRWSRRAWRRATCGSWWVRGCACAFGGGAQAGAQVDACQGCSTALAGVGAGAARGGSTAAVQASGCQPPQRHPGRRPTPTPPPRLQALARMGALGLQCRDVRTREVGIQDIHHQVGAPAGAVALGSHGLSLHARTLLSTVRAWGMPPAQCHTRPHTCGFAHTRPPPPQVRPDQVELVRRDYWANGGWETFLAYEDPRQVGHV